MISLHSVRLVRVTFMRLVGRQSDLSLVMLDQTPSYGQGQRSPLMGIRDVSPVS